MNSYKMIIPVLLLIFCLASLASADPMLLVDSYELTPAIFFPGDTGVLTISITNAETTNTIQSTSTGGSSTSVRTDMDGARINNIWIVPAEDGERQVSAVQNYEDVGELAPGASIELSFKIEVDNNMTEGDYFPLVRIDADGVDVKAPLLIPVSNATVELVSTMVPSKISMSGSSDFQFIAVNKRKAAVENVVITPQQTDGVDIVPTTLYLGSMDAFATEDVTFSVTPTSAGVKTLSFNISFDNGNNHHIQTQEVSVETTEVLDVGAVFTTLPARIKKGSTSRITLEVYNTKTESISGVLVLPTAEALMIPSQYFIGSMDADDVFAATFDLYTDTLDYGEHTVSFTVVFKQGSEYYETPPLTHTFTITSEDGAVYGSASNSDQSASDSAGMDIAGVCLPAVIVIVVLVALVLLYRWKKRRST